MKNAKKRAIIYASALTIGYGIGLYDGVRIAGRTRMFTGLLMVLLLFFVFVVFPKIIALFALKLKASRRRPPGDGPDDPPSVPVPRPGGGRPPRFAMAQKKVC